MYKRKISKKIFRRTRKHKFYDIKGRKKHSILTRKRVRRGGEVEVIHSPLTLIQSRHFYLDKEKCTELEKKFEEYSDTFPNKSIKYSKNAGEDAAYCDRKYKTSIVQKIINSMNRQKQHEQKNKEQEQGQEQQQEQEQSPEQEQEQEQSPEPESGDHPPVFVLPPPEDELPQEDKLDIFPTKCKTLQECRHEAGFNQIETENAYRLLYILKNFIIRNSRYFKINRLDNPNSIPNDPSQNGFNSVYYRVCESFFKSLKNNLYLRFIMFYNTKVKEAPREQFAILNPDEANASIGKAPDFLDVKKFLSILYRYYDMRLQIYCRYRLAETAFIYTDKEGKVVGVVNYRLITPTLFDFVSTDRENLLKIILNLNRQIEFNTRMVTNYGSNGLALQAALYDDLIPVNYYVLPIPSLQFPLQNVTYSYFSIVKDISEFLLKYKDVFCFTFMVSTKTDVRKKIEQDIISSTNEDIEQMVQNNSIFTNSLVFTNIDEIKRKLLKILRDNIAATLLCGEGEKFLQAITSADKTYIFNIFVNMIIFACYMTSDSAQRWGIKGTSLMKLYMNIFIIKYSNAILSEIVRSISSTYDDFLMKISSHDTGFVVLDNNMQLFFEAICELSKAIKEFKINPEILRDVEVEDTTQTSVDQLKQFLDVNIAGNNEKVLASIDFEGLLKKKDNSGDFNLMRLRNFNIYEKMLTESRLLKNLVSEKYKQKYGKKPPAELTEVPVQNRYLHNGKEYSKDEIAQYKEECKRLVVDMISDARDPIPAGFSKTIYPDLWNICADPADIFKKGKDHVEHKKRVSRFFYGLSELYPELTDDERKTIMNLPNVRSLLERLNGTGTHEDDLFGDKFKRMVEDQCIDDGKGEKKIFGFRRTMTANRKRIMANVDKDKLNDKCHKSVYESPLHGNRKLEPIFSDAENAQYTVESLENEKRSLDNIIAQLEERLAKLNRIVEIANETSDNKIVTHNSRKIPNLTNRIRTNQEKLIDVERELAEARIAQLRTAATPSESLVSAHGGFKRRSKTIKQRMHQQKQYKTKKRGRKYRASHRNKKTRKHLGPRHTRRRRR